ncbi:MAG: hypothetical protein ACYCO4_04905 [Sulfobacillus sp.]
MAAQASDAYAEAGFTVVVQDVIVGNFLTDFVRALHHRPVFVVVLAPSADAVQRREAQRPKKGYVDGWTVPELDRVLWTQTPPIGLWLDSSEQTAEQTADEAYRRLWAEARVR